MTRDVATCAPTDTVASVMETMRRRHIRHLPVIDPKHGLIAMISQRDVLGSLLEQTQLEVAVLRDRLIAAR
jgi:CBS domain-containing protein